MPEQWWASTLTRQIRSGRSTCPPGIRDVCEAVFDAPGVRRVAASLRFSTSAGAIIRVDVFIYDKQGSMAEGMGLKEMLTR